MFCSHCGKEISAQAIMCPFCGEPTKNASANIVGSEARVNKSKDSISGLSVVGLILSTFAFITGIIWGSFLYTSYQAAILMLIISPVCILPGIAGLSVSAYVANTCEKPNSTTRARTVMSIILSTVVLLFLFINFCLLTA